MKKSITVFTPTYNRAYILDKCYESLNRQRCKDFEWLIIDDGSTDGTEELVRKWQSEDNGYAIRYVYKANGGKHTALNLGFKEIQTELTFIVDSDDWITPNAIAEIIQTWRKRGTDKLAGISYLRGCSENMPIGTAFPNEGVFNGIDMQFRIKAHGDKAEVWRTDILRRYQFPVFEGERFQGENYVWWQIALEYDMYYVNKIIYITEYLEGGLTRSGRKLRINCPLGGMENSRMGLHKRFPLRERCKRAWLYVCYGKFAGKTFGELVSKSGYPGLIAWNYLFGSLLYHYWKIRYQ